MARAKKTATKPVEATVVTEPVEKAAADPRDVRIETLEQQVAELTDALAAVREKLHSHANHLQSLIVTPRAGLVTRIDDLQPVV